MNQQNWINQARDHWKEFQPTKYKALKKQGTLDLALKEAAERTYRETSELEDAGFQPDEAFQMVREEYLFPPDENAEQTQNRGTNLMHEAMELNQRTMEISREQ